MSQVSKHQAFCTVSRQLHHFRRLTMPATEPFSYALAVRGVGTAGQPSLVPKAPRWVNLSSKNRIQLDVQGGAVPNNHHLMWEPVVASSL